MSVSYDIIRQIDTHAGIDERKRSSCRSKHLYKLHTGVTLCLLFKVSLTSFVFYSADYTQQLVLLDSTAETGTAETNMRHASFLAVAENTSNNFYNLLVLSRE